MKGEEGVSFSLLLASPSPFSSPLPGIAGRQTSSMLCMYSIPQPTLHFMPEVVDEFMS